MRVATVLLLLAAAATAAALPSRDLLGGPRRCDYQKELKCGRHCVAFLRDPLNCGRCGRRCPNSFECRMGGCVCPEGRIQCDKSCTNTMLDPFNCGFCGNICSSFRCRGGACVGGDDACPVHTINCSGRCRHILNDENHCGACHFKCRESFVCKHGGCVCPHEAPDQCGTPAVCTNKMEDKRNCGFCGNRCGGGQRCHKGECIRKARMVSYVKRG